MPDPVDDALSDRHPFEALATRLDHDVFAMAMADAVFRQQAPAVRIGRFTACGGIAWVPV